MHQAVLACIVSLQMWDNASFFVVLRLDSEFTSEKLMKDEAERTMQHLMDLVQYTAVSIPILNIPFNVLFRW